MKNNEKAATLTAENYLEFSESIKKMDSEQFGEFVYAMYQGKHWPAFGKEKWVEAEMWNFAQCINDNYDLEDEEELNEAKDRVIRFFGDDYKYDYTNEEWDNFDKVTGEFLASYFEQADDQDIVDYECFSDFITALKKHESSPAYVAKDGKLHIIAWLNEKVKVDEDGCFDGWYHFEFYQGDDSIFACLNFVKDCPDGDVKWWFSGSCLNAEIPSYEDEKQYLGGLSGINGWSLYRKYIGYIKKIENAL